MAIGRSQIPQQIKGKLRGARDPYAKAVRSRKYRSKVIQSKKLYNRKKLNDKVMS